MASLAMQALQWAPMLYQGAKKAIQLGQKAKSGYEIGKKFLDGGISLGRKFVESAKTVEKSHLMGLLPESVRNVSKRGIEIADSIISKGEKFQGKLQKGEQLFGAVNNAYQVARSQMAGGDLERVKSLQRTGDVPKMIQRMGSSHAQELEMLKAQRSIRPDLPLPMPS